MRFSEKEPNCVNIFAIDPPVTYSNIMYKYLSVFVVPRYLLDRVRNDAT